MDAYCAQLLMYGFLKEARLRDPDEIARVLAEVVRNGTQASPAPAAAPKDELLERLERLEESARAHDRLLDKTVRALDELLSDSARDS